MEYSDRLVNAADCAIDRSSRPGRALLLDKEKDILFVFSGQWTDEQIWDALIFADEMHALGFSRGRSAKAKQVREALKSEYVSQALGVW